MLSLLKIRNVALIDSVEVEFGPGLNLLTGETGSGKSIIVDSLGALIGARTTADIIKDDRDAAEIEGIFTIGENPTLRKLLSEAGIDADGDDLIIRREILRSGRNRIFVNDRLVTAAFLKTVGPHLAEIFGQGESLSLYSASEHRQLLDDYARLGELLSRVSDAFSEFAAARRHLASLDRDESERLQMLDTLRFQINEISSVNLDPSEAENLEEEKRRLVNTGRLTELSSEALALLYESDDSTLSTLDRARRRVDDLAAFDRRFAAYGDGLDAARAVIEDLAFAVREYAAGIEFSPARLNEIEARLAEINRISRKYGGSAEAALAHLDEAKKKLAAIESAEESKEAASAAVVAARSKYISLARELSAARHRFADEYSQAVAAGLKDVALAKAKFEIRIDSDALHLEDEAGFGPAGADKVEFYFSANPGESPKPLAKIASGGEASRLMLILKTAARYLSDGRSLIFDEVDAGIGGRVAEAVGTKLRSLSAGGQVLCVTHQAQVASKADRHFVVEKKFGRGKTQIGIRLLDTAGRIEEIARMLAGERITDAARANAKELIASAQ